MHYQTSTSTRSETAFMIHESSSVYNGEGDKSTCIEQSRSSSRSTSCSNGPFMVLDPGLDPRLLLLGGGCPAKEGARAQGWLEYPLGDRLWHPSRLRRGGGVPTLNFIATGAPPGVLG